jgi:class I lanthipeptide synthase
MNSTLACHPTLSLVRSIADRMRESDRVKDLVLSPSNQNSDPAYHLHVWDDLSISSGYSGILLLFTELERHFGEEKWDTAAHQYVLKIKSSIESIGIASCSLYGGLAGICFAIQQASHDGTRYQKLLNVLNTILLERVQREYIAPIHEHLKEKKPCPATYYDTIQGISGIGLYYLMNLNSELFAKELTELVKLSISLTQPIMIDGHTVPGWYLSQKDQFIDLDKQRYPNGNFNLGLSHGIPGIVAFLSIALLHGVRVEGQEEAIERAVLWIQAKRQSHRFSSYWVKCVSFEEEISELRQNHNHGMDAWCYGSPGVARSLYLAGKALKKEDLKEYALRSFRTIFMRSREEWGLAGPTFCHGISGLLAITTVMAQETLDLELKNQVANLEQLLLQYYQGEYPFGFRDFEPMKEGSYAQIDKAGILEGASGVLLSLLAVHTSAYHWRMPFLIEDGMSNPALTCKI